MTETENLIAAGATLDSKDHNGYTPLMHAVKQQNTGMVKLLADHGANVNISDDLGDTPLVWASSSQSLLLMMTSSSPLYLSLWILTPLIVWGIWKTGAWIIEGFKEDKPPIIEDKD